jgi:hypothetical protein
MTREETKRVVGVLLEPYDRLDHLECDGLTRVTSYLLSKAGIDHVSMFGRLEMFGRVVEPHYWTVLEDTGLMIDYRARMWLDDKPEVPHGIFMEADYSGAAYFGDEIPLVTNRVIFDVLTKGLAR